LEALAHHTHCNSVQQIDSDVRKANVPECRKGSMAPLGHWWKRLVTGIASIVVDRDAIGLVVIVLVAGPARVIAEPGMAALQMPSARH